MFCLSTWKSLTEGEINYYFDADVDSMFYNSSIRPWTMLRRTGNHVPADCCY